MDGYLPSQFNRGVGNRGIKNFGPEDSF